MRAPDVAFVSREQIDLDSSAIARCDSALARLGGGGGGGEAAR